MDRKIVKRPNKNIWGERNPNFRSAHITKSMLVSLYVEKRFSSIECADRLSISRATLFRNLKKHGISVGYDRGKRLIGTCQICGKKFRYYPQRSAGIFCGKKCYGKSISGEQNRNWMGGPITVNCAHCGKLKKLVKSRAEMYLKHFCNMKCYQNWKVENLVGEANTNWRGGKSFEPYSPDWKEQIREVIRERDGRICVSCSKNETENEERLCVHHIDYDKENLSPDNLVSLCHSCHSQSGFNRNDWQFKLNELTN